MKITYRHGYSGDVSYVVESVEFYPSDTCPMFKLTVRDNPNSLLTRVLYAVSFYPEKGKYVFDCPENF